ncbi:hypothetical protein D5086_003559 [Populus alba]|uniref:Uncharacterized protein n=1 Tax=Populus alba TaxID=43335 RepID=A0ACC4D5A5_POPAL
MPRNSRSQSVSPFAEAKLWCRTSSRSIHAQEGSPEIQRQLNFGNRGIEVGMPRNSRVKAFRCFAEAIGMPRNSRSQSVSLFGRKCDVEQVAEAYMLKRDHPKFKGNEISATGASKSECRETHVVKAFRCLRKRSVM